MGAILRKLKYESYESCHFFLLHNTRYQSFIVLILEVRIYVNTEKTFCVRASDDVCIYFVGQTIHPIQTHNLLAVRRQRQPSHHIVAHIQFNSIISIINLAEKIEMLPAIFFLWNKCGS